VSTRAIDPPGRALDARVRPPGSKSITNRALVVAALARGTSELTGTLESDDTRVLAAALRTLGLDVRAERDRIAVTGCAGAVPPGPAELHVGGAGTAARFLPPLLALGAGPYALDGVPRMRERPIAPLLEALAALGARVETLGAPGHLPMRLSGGRLGRAVAVRGDISSQFLSGLLLSGPAYPSGLRVAVTGPLVSRPYVGITLAVMRAFGAEVEQDGDAFAVAPTGYTARAYAVEPDASAASYFFAAAAITGGRVVVEGLGHGSLQGDMAFVDILARMGCEVRATETETELTGPPPGGLRGVEADLSDLSDTAQTLAVVAPFANGPTRVTGIGFIRGKETDRVGAVVRELRRAGIDAAEEPDGFLVRPGTPRAARIATYDDHRMAMSFALLGLRVRGIEIEDPGCVAKTYPGYFTDLERALAGA
jgi:3-phosphoshikimate 1-carboxyvinyltransferase